MITEEQLRHELTAIRATLARIEDLMPSATEEELAQIIRATAAHHRGPIPARSFYHEVQRHAPRSGHRCIARAMEAMGFTRLKLEAGIFWLKPGDGRRAAPSEPTQQT